MKKLYDVTITFDPSSVKEEVHGVAHLRRHILRFHGDISMACGTGLFMTMKG